ncbi:MAG: FABP family protein [Ignavibacteriae bacterium]|nr:FABP family protein [Ignavibacteriota bacterium]MCB9244149.1 FABP family protein [Ignavibacteriales bacterium]
METVTSNLIPKLTPLLGKWTGKGTAQFPTIDTTGYTEEMVFAKYDYNDVIHYEQKVLHNTDDERDGKLLHWEAGYILFKEGKLFLINSQSNGRVEVMEGEVSTNGNELIAEFRSTLYGNDSKMISSSRRYTLKDDMLEYTLDMATSTAENPGNHLKCTLRRVFPK